MPVPPPPPASAMRGSLQGSESCATLPGMATELTIAVVGPAGLVGREILELLGRTGARPLVDSVFPFEQIRPAFEQLARGPMGKVLLAVNAGR